jgi:hypothetical protein
VIDERLYAAGGLKAFSTYELMLAVRELVRFAIDEGVSDNQKPQLDCQKLIKLRVSEILADIHGANAPMAAWQR